jgi:hypothetical protein
MIPELPGNALVAADVGYVAYKYVWALLDRGRQLLLRVGSRACTLLLESSCRQCHHMSDV